MVLGLKYYLSKESGFDVLRNLKILLSNLTIDTIDLQTQIILDIKRTFICTQRGKQTG